MSRWADDLALAEQAARAAGVVIMAFFRTDLEVTYKGPDQPLTQADLASDAILTQHLLDNRPDYGWLSEETADTAARLTRERVWIVDSIDGTRSFVAGRPEFAVSIGLVERGQVVLGVVYNPATEELYAAERDEGAFCVRTEQGGPGVRQPLSMSVPPVRATIAASRHELRRGELESFVSRYDILPTGSTAYKLAKVAAGAAHAFLSRGLKSEWDLCAGDLIVRQAGGLVSDLSGATLQYNRVDPHISGVVAAHGALHRIILEEISGTTG